MALAIRDQLPWPWPWPFSWPCPEETPPHGAFSPYAAPKPTQPRGNPDATCLRW